MNGLEKQKFGWRARIESIHGLIQGPLPTHQPYKHPHTLHNLTYYYIHTLHAYTTPTNL